MIRTFLFLILAAAPASAVIQSVEFPWATFPRALWERELVWLKNIGIAHVSLPPAPPARADELLELVRIVRRINLEADLEGPVPETLQSQLRAHGGPLTDPPAAATRVSALSSDALTRGRKLLAANIPFILWTDVEDTLGPSGYQAGAVNFIGTETAATVPLRRNAQLAKFWDSTLSSIHQVPGAGPKLPAPGIVAQQFASGSGASFIQVSNNTAKPWKGDLKATHPSQKRPILIAGVSIPAHDTLWLPVNLPLMAGALCRDCTAFATVDRLVSATAELTSVEYENGILAMEFSAPSAGEAIVQISREPSGPLVAGGKPAEFNWDSSTKQARLTIPAGKGPGNRVRIGLAIEAPDSTAFFDSAKVLLIGETNPLVAQFSSDAIMQRSRLRTAPELRVAQAADKDPLKSIYRIAVPDTAVHGDRTELSIEADGSRMSHANPEYMRPVQVRFTDGFAVQVGPHSALPLYPVAIPVNQRGGRDVTLSLRNNAPEIRTFHLELKADGLEFSPEKIDVTVGSSAARDVSFRVFAANASPGLHLGEARTTGAAESTDHVRFIVIPPSGATAWSADGFSFLESARLRAAFMPGRWLEYLNKENGQNALPAGGVPFSNPVPEPARLPDLEQQLPKPKK